MSVRAHIYAVSVTLAITAVVAISVGLYRDGSLAFSGWVTAINPGPLSEKHGFLSNKCETCHTPIKGLEAAACIACHTTSAVDLGKQSTAFHATSKECRGCHLEHAGGVRPIRIDHAVLLRATDFVRHSNGASPTVAGQMVNDLKEFLRIPKSDQPEKTGLDCATCHSNREPHRELFGRECASCHALDSWRIAQFLHPSPTSKDCAQCHQAPPSHYMHHFLMMDQMVTGQQQARVDQCFLCHRTDSFNDIKGIGWFKHH